MANLVSQMRAGPDGVTVRIWEVPDAYEIIPDEAWCEQPADPAAGWPSGSSSPAWSWAWPPPPSWSGRPGRPTGPPSNTTRPRPAKPTLSPSTIAAILRHPLRAHRLARAIKRASR